MTGLPAAPVQTASPCEAVDTVLHGYAKRGVFQDYRMDRRRNGAAEYNFGWLYGQPFTLLVEPKHARLSLPDLLPNVLRDSMMHKELKTFLKDRAGADVPAHRRVDPALATAALRLRGGLLSLELRLTSGDYGYGASKLINLTHELFLFLNEYWAEYMWDNFRLNME
jgi:hypothetical protein